jgi:hypothetical protein
MSKAKTQFDESIKDAEELLSHYDRATGGKVSAPPKDAEVLKRAGLILALTAWETYVEDRVKEALEAQLAGLKGSPVHALVLKKFDEEMKRFHTPNTEKTRELFQSYTGKDVTKAWTTWGGDAAKAAAKLNELVKQRGQAAHRSKVSSATPKKGVAPHLITRDNLGKAVNFLKALVESTENEMKP